MKWTNKYNINPKIASAISKERDVHSYITASQMSKSPRQFHLYNRHKHEMVKDVSEMLEAFYGTALHDYMERLEQGVHIITEQRHKTIVHGEEVSGQFDWFNAKTGELKDHKRTTVWSIVFGSSLQKWTDQLNCLAWLMSKHGVKVESLTIEYHIRDWQKSKANGDNYPKCQNGFVNIKLWTKEQQEETFSNIVECFKDETGFTDDKLSECDAEQLWQKPDTYAVKKSGRKTAIKVCNSEKEAEEYIKNNFQNGMFIEKRESVVRGCGYCDCRPWCNQYDKLKKDGLILEV